MELGRLKMLQGRLKIDLDRLKIELDRLKMELGRSKVGYILKIAVTWRFSCNFHLTHDFPHQSLPISVWAKQKGFPHWPAKLFKRYDVDGEPCCDVRFFGR